VTTWQLGGPGSNYSGWQSIQILDPTPMTSEKANFTIHCLAPHRVESTTLIAPSIAQLRTALCPIGEKALSGGAVLSSNKLFLSASFPAVGPFGESAWGVIVINTDNPPPVNHAVTVYAMCAKP
jgi:hypothetical protein